jgi:hypothetical protein
VDNLERLIIDVKESLEREIRGLIDGQHSLQSEMREGFAQINTRFDTQAARLDRHAGLWQTGSRWSSRMDAWAEKVDGALEAKDREIAELRERLIRLERKSA